MRLLLTCVLCVLPATAMADRTADVRTMASDDCARARKAGKTCVLTIEDETIEGAVMTGAGEKIEGLVIGKSASLITIRRDFVTEILRSAEDID